MSAQVKAINSFFRTAIKDDVDRIAGSICLSERQEEVFRMFYIKKNDINFIADTLCVCPQVVNKELRTIRDKMAKALDI